MPYRTKEQVINSFKASVTAAVPAITNWGTGTVEYAFVSLVGLASEIMYRIVQTLRKSIFLSTADREGLRAHFEDLALVWVGGTTDAARKTALTKYRERSLGTPSWYEDYVKDNYGDVENADYIPFTSGPNTATLLISSAGGVSVSEATVAAITAYFNQADKCVVCRDLEVVTTRDVEDKILEIEELGVYG